MLAAMKRSAIVLTLFFILLFAGRAYAFPGDISLPDGDAAPECIDLTDAAAVPPSSIELRAAGAGRLDTLSVLPLRPIDLTTADAALQSYARVVNGDVPIYDAPAGNVMGSTGDGFVFYTTSGSQQGPDGDMWTAINGGEWVRQSDLKWREPTQFKGVYIDAWPEREFAWVLDPNQPLLTPAGLPNKQASFLERYQLVTLYATEYVGEWRYYLIGPDQWVHETWIGKAAIYLPPEGVSGRWIDIDLYEQTLVAYEDARPVFATLIASGLEQWSTEEGLFKVYYKVINGPMSGAEGEADFYHLENVPYSIYFDRGKAIHGAYWHDGFGYRRSHGCVNVAPADAMLLFQWIEEGDWVHVRSSAEYR